MPDALTGLTEVDATIEDIISSQVQDVLTAMAVMPPVIMDYTSMVQPGMDTVKIPYMSNFTVNTKAENTALSAQVNALATTDLKMDKHKGIQLLIEDIAELQSKLMLSNIYMEQAGKDLAADMDDVIITALEALPSAAAPDHILDFSNTPTDTISKGDFLAARAALNTAKVSQADRFCLISPNREKDILAISEFVRVDESGGSAALRNGQIGRLFGFDVLMSPLADDDATLFFHKSCAVFARQLMPRVQQQLDLANLATRWSIDHIFGVKGLDGKRIVKIKDGGA